MLETAVAVGAVEIGRVLRKLTDLKVVLEVRRHVRAEPAVPVGAPVEVGPCQALEIAGNLVTRIDGSFR